MNEPSEERPTSRPGIVIFVAVLNFLSSLFYFAAAVLIILIVLFGKVLALQDAFIDRMQRSIPEIHWSLGFHMVILVVIMVVLIMGIIHLFMGIGLMKGNALAWYFQIAISVIGLAVAPLGTVLSVVIIIFFFQEPTRRYFKT